MTVACVVEGGFISVQITFAMPIHFYKKWHSFSDVIALLTIGATHRLISAIQAVLVPVTIKCILVDGPVVAFERGEDAFLEAEAVTAPPEFARLNFTFNRVRKMYSMSDASTPCIQ